MEGGPLFAAVIADLQHRVMHQHQQHQQQHKQATRRNVKSVQEEKNTGRAYHPSTENVTVSSVPPPSIWFVHLLN
jgi:hypothetical protein